MKNSNRKIEVLSPAKNIQYGIEAIKCGADSVYIACEKLGLRKFFSNSIEDIKQLCDFAHKYWAKVYVTINSIIYTKEDLEYAQELIKKLYLNGVDAIIITDMGILTLDLPPIPIYASVNTRCFTPEKINFMEKVGIQRIILPRELTFEQIKNIAKNTSIPLEVFIHGTFCVGISGNCFLKYAQVIKNSSNNKELNKCQLLSANNGACPAVCYDKYNLMDANNNYIVKDEYLFRLRFLDLLNKIDKFISIGVHSFKIEGRQRRLSYVKNITTLCSEEVNKVLKKQETNLFRLSSGTSIVNFEPNLNKIYNRGYTDYFFNGRKKENLSAFDTYGNYIGKVKEQNNNSFKTDSNINLNIGDKILYQSINKQTGIFDIIDIKNDFYIFSNDNINILNCDLYRVIDAKIAEDIENSKTYRYLSAKITIKNKKDIYTITINDEDNINTSIEYNIKTNKKISKNDFINVFNNEIESEIKITEIDSENDIYIDKQDLNAIKNILCKKHINKRIKYRPIEKGYINKKSTEKYPEEITYLDNICNSKAEEFYQQHGINNPEWGLESTKDIEGKKIYVGKYCIRYELGYCSKLKREDTPPFPWKIQNKYGTIHNLEFDCKNCKMHVIY